MLADSNTKPEAAQYAVQPLLARELQDEVLSELDPVSDRATLLVCALVSQAWHTVTRTHLFSRVSLNVGTKEGLTMKQFFVFVVRCAELAFSEEKSQVPSAPTFVREVTILGVPFSIHHQPCIPDVVFDNLRNLIASLPSLETLHIDRVCLKTDIRPEAARALDWKPLRELKSLKMDLDTLEVNCVVAWVLSLFSSVEHLDLRCRISRRKVGFPMSYFMADGVSPIPSGPTENVPLAIRRAEVDSDYHFPELVRYLRQARDLQDIKELSVRCYNDKDVIALKRLLDEPEPLVIESLTLGSSK